MAAGGGYSAEPIIELAFSQGPYDEPLDTQWTDISSSAYAATITRGRSSEFDQYPPGTASVGLRNDDRAFDVFNTSSPYDGLLEPNVPLRILARVPEPVTFYVDEFLASPFIASFWEITHGEVDAQNGNGAEMDATGSGNLFNMYGHVGVITRGMVMTVELTNVSNNITIYIGTGQPVSDPSTGFSINGAVLAFVGAGGTVGTLTYNATNHRWLRVQNEGADTVWLTSPDGTTWTERDRETGLFQPTTLSRVAVAMNSSATANLRHFELSGDIVPLYRGVTDGWPSEYMEGGAFSDVEVPSTDAFKTLAERPMPDTYKLFLETFSTLDPEEWYRFDDVVQGTVKDVYGVREGYTYGTVNTSPALCYVSKGGLTMPAEPSIPNGLWRWPVAWPIGQDPNDTPLRGTTWSVSFWMQLASRSSHPTNAAFMFFNQNVGGSETGQGFEMVWAAVFPATGLINVAILTPGATFNLLMNSASGTTVANAVDVADGAAHQITIIRNATQAFLYVDGRIIVTDTEAGATSWYDMRGGATHLMRNVGSNNTYPIPEVAFDEVLFFDQALSAADVLELYEHQTQGWHATISTGAAVTAVLDLIGWPIELRSIDEGTTTVQSLANPEGIRALDYLQSIAATEGGRLFIDAMGRVCFQERGRELWDVHQADVQYAFTDVDRDSGWADVGTRDGTLRVRLDDRHVYDGARVQRVGGEPQESKLVTDPVRTYDLSGLLFADDLQSLGLAEWVTFRYGTPQARSEAWEVDPEVLPEHWGRLLALEVGHRIEHTVTPGGVGSSLTLDQHVEVVQHSIDLETWTLTLNGVPADPTEYLLWAPEDVASTSDPNGWGDTDNEPPGGAWG